MGADGSPILTDEADWLSAETRHGGSWETSHNNRHPTTGMGANRKERKMFKSNETSKQRQVSSQIPVSEQLANLKSLIKNPPQNSRVIEVTPEVATFILEELNIGNRNRKTMKIAEYARDMQRGKWTLTGEALKFGTDGLLKDGQNRLAACMRAGVPFKTHAVFGIDPATFSYMDTGAHRNNTDVFVIMGVPYPRETGPVLRLIAAFDEGKGHSKSTRFSNDQLRDTYNNATSHYILEEAIKMAKRVSKTTAFPVVPLAALLYIAIDGGHEEKARAFADDMAAGIGAPRSPVRYMLEAIGRMKIDRRFGLNVHTYSILLGNAWFNYRNGVSSKKTDVTIESNDKMPVIC